MSLPGELNIEEFKEVLREAILWCASRASLQDPSRSLRMLPLSTAPFFFALPPADQAALVADLVAARRLRIHTGAGLHTDAIESPDDGKLLLFYPDGSLSDGAAEAASRGFFDNYNLPASDTWVYYGTDGSGSRNFDQNFLVSWIPRQFVPLVNDGITVNPEGCIEWASARDRVFTRFLGAQKMLY